MRLTNLTHLVLPFLLIFFLASCNSDGSDTDFTDGDTVSGDGDMVESDEDNGQTDGDQSIDGDTTIDGDNADGDGDLEGELDGCIPDCNDKKCGPDGCGGFCGTCKGNNQACLEGKCECVPYCGDNECGDNGCGGTCGTCGSEENCCYGNCISTRPYCSCHCTCWYATADTTCNGYDCGPTCFNVCQDTCSGDAGGLRSYSGDCYLGECNDCSPKCDGKQCGDDGCGGTCGMCDQGFACVDSACLAVDCNFASEGAPCNDGTMCTTEGTCHNGECSGTNVVDCTDQVDCTDDICDPEKGCVSKENDENCDDGIECTTDSCSKSEGCQYELDHDICDDDNVCTTDRCDFEQGCVNVGNQAFCDDGNDCTGPDICDGEGECFGEPYDCNEHGICDPESRYCLCAERYSGDYCDACADGYIGYPECIDDLCDPDPCHGHGICDTVDASCTCDNPYMNEDCSVCTEGYIGYPECRDNPCNPDPCHGHGVCNGTDGSCTCDNEYMTADCGACQANSGGYPDCVPCSCTVGDDCCMNGCFWDAQGTTCGESNFACTIMQCNTEHACVEIVSEGCLIEGTCVSEGQQQDTDGCIACDPSRNKRDWSYMDGTVCVDDNACTHSDKCTSGICSGTDYSCASPGLCETAIGATCDGLGGCLYFADTGAVCDDDDDCTHTDKCQSDKSCVGTTYSCNSPGSCETASGALCDGLGGCSYPADTDAVCDDMDDCTYGETCDAFKMCQGGINYSCNDHGTCNSDDDNCICNLGFAGEYCNECAIGFVGYPICDECSDEAISPYPFCFLPGVGYCDNHPCWPVPPSGQVQCYDNTQPIACPGEAGDESCATIDFCGQDAQYDDRQRNFNAYDIFDEGVVEDSLTGLMWQHELPEMYAGCTGGNPGGSKCQWQEAIDYCDGLTYAGFSDWRLPNAHELRSLVNYGMYDSSSNLPDMPSSEFWSSSPQVGSMGTGAWDVSFKGGSMDGNAIWDDEIVRCVRLGSGESSTGLFDPFDILSNPGEEIVSDKVTGLAWAKNYEMDKSWLEALSYCEELTYAGFSDWRLPNIQELASMINYENFSPASDFPDMPSTGFWSSSSSVDFSITAWTVDFTHGFINTYHKDNLLGARCVRSGP